MTDINKSQAEPETQSLTATTVSNPEKISKPVKLWSLYIIEDKNGRLYTGITNDVAARLAVHESGKGAKALRGKSPLTLRYQSEVGNRSLASHYEYCVKQLSKQKKLQLIKCNLPLQHYFSHSTE